MLIGLVHLVPSSEFYFYEKKLQPIDSMETLEIPHMNQKAVWEKHFELWTLPDLEMVFLKCSFWFSFIYTDVQAFGRFINKAPSP